jgi:alkylation response protein AidB-like acyl-CoA dehydrogenase
MASIVIVIGPSPSESTGGPCAAAATAERLEAALGDPLDPANAMSHARVMAGDEAERFPRDSCATLHHLGYLRWSTDPREPAWCFEEILATTRVIARRDVTVAIALGQTLLGAIPVLLAGSADQRRVLGRHLDAGGFGCLALTEREHGSDLSRTETAVASLGDGGALSGTKWLINNATVGATYTVLVRAAAADGDRRRTGLDLLYLDKASLDPARWRTLPKIPTLGIRGADISGVSFDRCPVSPASAVGKPGGGLETTLKTLQISRILCAGFSLGAADTALRTALAFALGRALYNGRLVVDIGAARSALTTAFIDLLACEAVAIVTHRALHWGRPYLSLWSAVAKYFVPTVLDDVIRRCAHVLGARYYLRDGHRAGIFQKCLRDSAVVGLFDGSTAVNLNIIAAHLPSLAAQHRAAAGGSAHAERRDRVDALGALHGPLDRRPFPSGADLPLTVDGPDPLVGAVAETGPGLDDVPAPLKSRLGPLVRGLQARTEQIHRAAARTRESRAFDARSEPMFGLARAYCAVFAGAACLLLWRRNRGRRDDFFGRGAWLPLCLSRLAAPDVTTAADPELEAEATDELFRLYRGDRLFSLVPLALAPGAGADRS